MRTRHKQGLAAGAAVLAVLVAAPAIGAAAHDDPGVQPPPGASAQKTTHVAPVPAQPKPNAPAVKATKVAPVPKQPVNRHPVKSTGFRYGLRLRHSKVDHGKKNLPVRKDHGKKHLPVQRG